MSSELLLKWLSVSQNSQIVSEGKPLPRVRSAAWSSHAEFNGIFPSTSIREESAGNRRWSSASPARAEMGANRRYMIAVGGAGSSGRPALASGTRIITATSIAKAIKGATAESPMAR